MSTPQPAPAAAPDWRTLAEAVHRAFAGSPYRVEASPERIVVHADLADARFLALGGARRVQRTYRTELTPAGPGRVAWQDAEGELAWTAGVDGRLVPRVVGSTSTRSGMVVTRSTSIELGVDRDGPGAPVAYAFDSAEVHAPLRAAIAEAGFTRTMGQAAKVGLWVGLGVGGAAVLGAIVLVAALVVAPLVA